MTRINSGIKPAELPNKLLFAELYEIQRLTKIVHKRSSSSFVPKDFKLGKGHVTFFYDKGLYTFKRYCDLLKEATKRGYLVKDASNRWESYPVELFNDWVECDNCRSIILGRFAEKGHVLLTHYDYPNPLLEGWKTDKKNS